jgi:hypothetical protein
MSNARHQPSGTCLLDHFGCDAWSWTCLTGRRDKLCWCCNVIEDCYLSKAFSMASLGFGIIHDGNRVKERGRNNAEYIAFDRRGNTGGRHPVKRKRPPSSCNGPMHKKRKHCLQQRATRQYRPQSKLHRRSPKSHSPLDQGSIVAAVSSIEGRLPLPSQALLHHKACIYTAAPFTASDPGWL